MDSKSQILQKARSLLKSKKVAATLVLIVALTLFLKPRSKEIYSGSLEVNEYLLCARTSGRVSEVFAKEGDKVAANQELARLDRYEQMSRDYQRQLALLQSHASCLQQVEWAKLEVEDQLVTAPCEGEILTQFHDLGEVVGAGTPLFLLGDMKRIWARIYVSEAKVAQIKIGQRATIQVDGLKTEIQGHIGYIASKAQFSPRQAHTLEDRSQLTYAVKIFLDDPPNELRPGIYANITLCQDKQLL